MNSHYDVIVIGSGIGGLTCAAALAKFGYRVLVLEQHSRAGGLTQTFSRKGFTWDVGLHYIGDMMPDDRMRRLLDWLTDDPIAMAHLDPEYDVIHFPDNFTFAYNAPPEKLISDLKNNFPGSSFEIDRFITALSESTETMRTATFLRSIPKPLSRMLILLKHKAFRQWIDRTTGQVLEDFISDKKLRALLSAHWPTHGSVPGISSFGVHATIMQHFMKGAFYPKGGSGVFSDTFIPIIEKAGGKVILRSNVRQAILNIGKVKGVVLDDGKEYRAKKVVSAIGAKNTVTRLLPKKLQSTAWAMDIKSVKSSNSTIVLYIGFEGDISKGGASVSNHYYYNTWDMDKTIWNNPDSDNSITTMFVSFPSLKDPHHQPGKKMKHTAQVITIVRPEIFKKWESSSLGRRPEEYYQFKTQLEKKLLRAFKTHYPALEPMISYYELSTSLTNAFYTNAYEGSYGLETSPQRVLSRSLDARTPIDGLYLTGQDTGLPGIFGAFTGGLLTASAIEWKILIQLMKSSLMKK